MIAESRLEFDSDVQQELVRPFELHDEVGWPLRTIKVIANHQNQIERELLSDSHHLVSYLILRRIASAVISDYRKLHRPGIIREWRHRVRG